MTKIEMDSTMLSDYLVCPRKYYLRYVLDLVPKRETKGARDFGETFHKVLSTWYRTKNAELSIKHFADWEDTDDPRYTKEAAIRIFTNYVLEYKDQPWKVIANEIPFELLLTKEYRTEYWYIGKIDLLVEWAETGGLLYGVDHKTTSRMSNLADKFRKSPQCTGYIYALKNLYGDSVQGLVINAISTAKTAGTGKAKMFDQYLSTRLPWELSEFVDLTVMRMRKIRIGREMLNLGQKNALREYFPPNYTSCGIYGACRYMLACAENLSQRVIEENYTRDHWDPRQVWEADTD